MPTITPIPAFHDNYIWLLVNQQRALVVDPGDATPVLNHLDQHHLKLTDILITHHHQDHTGGVKQLVETTGARVVAPEHTPLAYCDLRLLDGDQLELPEFDLTFTIMTVPGHTLDHIAYYSPGMLFCGDTLFAGGCGRVFEGSMEMMHRSLEKINALPEDTAVYCAHEYTMNNLSFAAQVEPDNDILKKRLRETAQCRAKNQPSVPSTIKIERDTNPFLRCHQPSVIARAEQKTGEKLNQPHHVFATLRNWKDHA